jgi:NitT/TauT family transport system substrate-binding protein
MSVDKLRYSSDGGLFNLPWLVAQQEGYFTDEGLDVEIVNRDPAEPMYDCYSRKKENDFLTGTTQLYAVCEWGAIKRTAEPDNGGRIAFRMPIAAQYTLVVAGDAGINRPEDLADVPVAVAQDAGSYYGAIETLEQYLPGERIKVEHVGGALARLEALLAGQVKAAVLMEPYTTIATRRGARVLLQCRPDKGAVVAADQLDAAVLERFARATNRAVQAINADPARYKDILLEEVPEHLREDVLPPRYAETERFAPEDFEQLHSWMVDHTMIAPNVRYEAITRPALRS